METLAALLRRHRVAAGLTQARLAEMAGLSAHAISLLKRGTRRRPRVETVKALTAALGLDPESAEQLLLAAKTPRRPRVEQAAPPRAPDPVLPRQLPPALADFTGRDAE